MWNLGKRNSGTENRLLLVRRWEGVVGRGNGEGGQKVHIFSYKVDKFWRYKAQHGDYS